MALPHDVLKECGGRVEDAAARLGAREHVWKHRQRQRLGITSSGRATVGA